jgi:hypothetical protein
VVCVDALNETNMLSGALHGSVLNNATRGLAVLERATGVDVLAIGIATIVCVAVPVFPVLLFRAVT